MGMKNELKGKKFAKILNVPHVWESTTMIMPIADSIMNFLFDFAKKITPK